MNAPTEQFVFTEAIRAQTPLLLGLVGPSGSGKTYSALRLAGGIQSVVGGDIAMIDTEARRALHYAGGFRFKHLPFEPPHGSDRYLGAIRAAVGIGARTIIVDSTSHEHEGEGGLLEWHEAELDRMAGNDYKKREAMNMLAWAKPKGARRKLINGLLQLNANFIFCFRAKSKVKPMKNAQGKTEIVDMGWQPIAGEEFVYEMTDRFLLLPGSEGRPAWDKEAWDTGVPKLPGDHRDYFPENAQLNEEIGARLAEWALGAPGPLGDDVLQAFASIGVKPEEIKARLKREPNSHDTRALKEWFRELRKTRQGEPARTVDRSTAQTEPASSDGGAPVVSYATVADKLRSARDRDALDEAATLIAAVDAGQQADLQKLYDQRAEEVGT